MSPRPAVTKCNINFIPALTDYTTQSNDIGVKIGSFIGKTFRTVILDAMKGPIEGLLPTFANNAILDIKEDYHGHVGEGLFKILLNMLPPNNIEISQDVTMSYTEYNYYVAQIASGRVTGYFNGDITLPL